MEKTKLAQRIKEAPETPGVYTWRGKGGQVLYVGKAVNVRSRLLSYAKTKDSRIATMVAEARAVDWEDTPTDIEALILESRLIKLHRPKFNIVMRDDKQYFYIGFTKDDFPRIFLTHQPTGVQSIKTKVQRESGSSTQYSVLSTSSIGPFTEGAPLKAMLRVLRKSFPYCTCKQNHHVKCLNAHLGKCLGICCLKKTESRGTNNELREYRRNIRAIRDVLTGKRDALVRRLARENPEIALRLLRVFQNAQINTRLRIPTLARKTRNALQRVEGYDIANIQDEHAVGAMVVFTNGAPNTREYRLFNIRETAGDIPMLREMLERRFKHRDWPLPDLIVVDGGKAQLNAVLSHIEHGKLNIPVIALTKDDRHRGTKIIEKRGDTFHERPLVALPASEHNLILQVDGEAHRFAISHYRRRHRKRLVE